MAVFVNTVCVKGNSFKKFRQCKTFQQVIKDCPESEQEEGLVKLNIRGKHFELDRQTLLNQDGSLLQKIAQQQTPDVTKQPGFIPPYFNRQQEEEDEYRQKVIKQWDFEMKMRRESSEVVKRYNRKWKGKLYLFLEEPRSSVWAMLWSVFMQLVTLLSIIVVVLETVPSMRKNPADKPDHDARFVRKDNGSETLAFLTGTVPVFSLTVMEYITVLVLSIDLVLRYSVSKNKRDFFLSVGNLCDLFSLLPSYVLGIIVIITMTSKLPTEIARILSILGIVRIIRITRIIHLARHYQTPKIISAALCESYKEFGLLLILLMCASTFFAALLYYVEIESDNVEHIPLAIWWALVTMTTVGYGDFTPITTGGYFVGGLCAVTGILIIALPTPIIVNNFSRLYETYKTCQRLAKRKCSKNNINDKQVNCDKSLQLKNSEKDGIEQDEELSQKSVKEVEIELKRSDSILNYVPVLSDVSEEESVSKVSNGQNEHTCVSGDPDIPPHKVSILI